MLCLLAFPVTSVTSCPAKLAVLVLESRSEVESCACFWLSDTWRVLRNHRLRRGEGGHSAVSRPGLPWERWPRGLSCVGRTAVDLPEVCLEAGCEASEAPGDTKLPFFSFFKFIYFERERE